MDEQSMETTPLLKSETKIYDQWDRTPTPTRTRTRTRTRTLFLLLFVFIISASGLVFKHNTHLWAGTREIEHKVSGRTGAEDADVVESEQGVVAADDGRCSAIGVLMLRQGGHAVDAAVATALCLGVVNPVSSGIGGGAFMVIRSSLTSKTQAFDMRETAPLAATQEMYEKNPSAKYYGALSMGVPGEIAGLHEAWLQHGRLAWTTLFQPAIQLARNGFVVSRYLGSEITQNKLRIMTDPGLHQVFAPKGKLLKQGDTCKNLELAQTLDSIAKEGPKAYYNGSVGEKLVKDVKAAGGILTMEDLKSYKIKVTKAMSVNVMGYTISGMPLPSSGILGLSMVLNILENYGNSDAADGDLALHRLIEAMKHMFAARMNLGDPAFVNVTEYVDKMLSPSYAKQIQAKIFDNTTFPPEYYMHRWSPVRDQGTSHFSVVDADRNVVSMTTTVNYAFGAKVLSPSTGIVINNEMGDFSVPTEIKADKLPPAPSNFIRPNKRPLSSMTPLIITKDDQFVGAIGGSGGMRIIPAVIQVFLNHFISRMAPLAAVKSPRVYHRLIPNIVEYENWTVLDGDHIELTAERKLFLKERGHRLESKAGGATVQLVTQTLRKPSNIGRKTDKYFNNDKKFPGELTAVSDPRKDGKPAAL